MVPMHQVIRQKRFQVKTHGLLSVTIRDDSGRTHVLDMLDCSLYGFGIAARGLLPPPDMAIGSIVPSATLSGPDLHVDLGRCVVRWTHTADGGYRAGLSLIDLRVPIDRLTVTHLETAMTTGGDANPYSYEISADVFNLSTFASLEHNNVDLFARCHQFGLFYNHWKQTPKFRYGQVRKRSMGPRVRMNQTRRGGRDDFLVFGSNDYLGLAAHPEVIESTRQAVERYGFGSTGSPVTTGTTDLHEELSFEIARLLGKERVLLFNSGYAANVGAIAGLTTARDLIVADVLSHASIQDGMQMSRASKELFRHNDLSSLDDILRRRRGAHAGTLVVSEGVFSMDGDTPALDELTRVAKAHGARLFVDEAHSFGVLGERGLGAAEKHGVLDQVDVYMGTFSKICGGIGGFIAAERDVCDWLYYYARAHMFSVSLPPSTAAAMLAALRVFVSTPKIRERLRDNIAAFVKGLRSIGYPIAEDHESSIVPVMVRDEAKIGIMADVFHDAGIHVLPVVYPAVSRTGSRFRFTITADHTASDLEYVVDVIDRARRKAGLEFEAAPTVTAEPAVPVLRIAS